MWIDAEGRCYGFPAAGRWLYFVARGDGLDFAGHGARRCEGCGVTVSPDPDTGDPLEACPLCRHPRSGRVG